jgi:hypothetical protein
MLKPVSGKPSVLAYKSLIKKSPSMVSTYTVELNDFPSKTNDLQVFFAQAQTKFGTSQSIDIP